ncbi:MAG TPA: hypothetical protein VJ021_01195 [Thermoplasmata archaeon]|nr:hypothetical protein [Thermoplasmata archaeon]
MTEEPPKGGRRRRVHRGEGEVTEWPRGLVDYLPSGAPEETPSPEEDRDLNRLRLASRLLGFARSQGHSVEGAVGRLREADRAFRAGDREAGRRIVDDVLSEVERVTGADPHRAKPTS